MLKHLESAKFPPTAGLSEPGFGVHSASSYFSRPFGFCFLRSLCSCSFLDARVCGELRIQFIYGSLMSRSSVNSSSFCYLPQLRAQPRANRKQFSSFISYLSHLADDVTGFGLLSQFKFTFSRSKVVDFVSSVACW